MGGIDEHLKLSNVSIPCLSLCLNFSEDTLPNPAVKSEEWSGWLLNVALVAVCIILISLGNCCYLDISCTSDHN